MGVTPRLDYAEVAFYVKALPDETLEVLGRGPVPDDSCIRCNVCEAIEPLLPRNETPPRPDTMAPAEWAALQLKEWHDDLAVHPLVEGPLYRWIPADREDELEMVRRGLCGKPRESGAHMRDSMLGETAHARCCTIYALATAEILARARLAETTA